MKITSSAIVAPDFKDHPTDKKWAQRMQQLVVQLIAAVNDLYDKNTTLEARVKALGG